MKKTFQKTLIAAAAGAALMSAVGTANANSLLFPYFTTATGAQSVLSLSNTSAVTQGLHYVYNYGTACTHFDANGSLTANDILSHSVAQPAGFSTTGAVRAGAPGAGGFGKVVSTDTSTPVYFPLANQQGFLVVSTTTANTTQGLQGSMAIVDPATGLVVSYAGISNGLNTALNTNEGNFTNLTDVNFALSTMPSALVTTSWYAVVVGDMQAVITAGADWRGAATFTNNGFVYNNDEFATSGTVTKTVTCAGTVLSTDLMTGAQAAAVGTNGGLIRTTASLASGATSSASGVVMMKMQTVQAAVGAPFAGKQFLHRESASN
ncbi:hypothetical protein HZ993_12175 [Rhodoferax sp. AJA081-3]|uniref:hypothetical protein n=1 Tax=Rhodoferax sp. AJA081-3 TaxID=2752316 RepID=UPI001ADFD9EB|nr:hypothetical protein [Rhodoferax sp. AJA081-3]QTN26110.1 hypothetical protein HZ993_12175 [Rhodoferax sp. AJA081-3]